MYKLLSSRLARTWTAIIGAATLVLAGSYTMVQQSTRMAVDDLPRTTAQTIKLQLDNGATANDVVPAQNINLRTNDNLFVIITDSTAHVLASSAVLDGQSPLPPKGVFSFTAVHGTDQFSWQPTSKVRLATRVISYKDGFIITGQSLRPAEERIGVYTELALASWIAVVAWTTLFLILPERKLARSK